MPVWRRRKHAEGEPPAVTTDGQSVAASRRWTAAAALSLRRGLLHVACVSVLVAVSLYIRWPATEVETFRNEDVAGITYNADLLARGGAPLVDNLELKAPGSFFITWGVWKLGGRSVRSLERFGVFWAILAVVGVYVGGCLLFGTAAGAAAGLIYAVWSPITDSITVNYNAWMITAYIWSTVLFVAGLRRGGWGWFLGSGVLLTFAGLLKRQGGVLLPIFVLVLAIGPLLQRPPGWARPLRRRWLLALVGGLALGALPITLFYLFRSGLDGVFKFYEHFLFSPGGWRYVGGEVDWKAKLDRLEDGLLGFWEFMALPTLLTTMAIVSVPLARHRGWTVRGLLLGGHFLLSCLGLALGFRFYMGYYLQALPAAAWIASHPDGPLLRWFHPGQWPDRLWPAASRVALLLCMVLACVPAVLADAPDLKKVHGQRKRFNAYQHEAEKLAQVIRDNSRPGDPIWVWGRWAWPVYFHADRASCTPYYKVLGVITNNLDNTWKRPTSMTRFNRTGPWREIGRQLEECRPRFIVTSNNESYVGFEPFERLLAKEYRPVSGVHARSFRLFQRKDLKLKPPHQRRDRSPALKRYPPAAGESARAASKLVPGLVPRKPSVANHAGSRSKLPQPRSRPDR